MFNKFISDDIETTLHIIKAKYPYMLTFESSKLTGAEYRSFLSKIHYDMHLWKNSTLYLHDLVLEMEESSDRYFVTYLNYNNTLYIFFKEEDDAVKYALLLDE